MKSILLAGAAALMLSACMAPRHEVVVASGPGVAVAYDGYYDGYYGPYYDGFWGDDGYFYYSDVNHHWVRDDNHHFRRDTATGYNHVVVHNRPTDVTIGTRP